jgi:hypothetical protein
MSLFSRRSKAGVMEGFENFDIEIFGYELDNSTESVRVRVRDSPMAGHGPDEYERVELPPGVRERAKQLETRDLNIKGMQQLGSDLASVLLPEKARRLYEESLASLEPSRGLRIRLWLGTWALADLPWEYCYILPRGAPEKEQVSLGFLCLNRRLSMVRFEIVQGPKQDLGPLAEDKLRLLALTSQPGNSVELALQTETDWIDQTISNIHGLDLEVLHHATWSAFQSKLDQAVHIVHFAGHGRFEIEMGQDFGTLEGKGTLLFETESGDVDARPAQDMALMLNQTGVRLTVLSACEGGRVDGIRAWSGIAPALARSGVPAIIAMQFRVRDDKAVAFSRRFYENLAAGGSIDSATTAGRLAMFDSSNDYGRDWGAPVLYLNADEGRLFPRSEEAVNTRWLTRRFAVNASLGIAAFLLGVIYTLLHFSPWFSDVYLLGGASLPLVLSLLLLAVGKVFDTALEDGLREWLKKKRATPWLISACCVLVALGFFTTSIHIIPAPDSTESYDFKLLAPALLPDTNWEIANKPKGKIFLFRVWRPVTVSINPGSGSGFSNIERDLYPWGSIHLNVPGDLNSKKVTLLRLIPTFRMWNRLQRGNDVVLRITVAEKQPMEISNLPRSVFVVGDTQPEVNRKLTAVAAELEQRLETHLQRSGMDEGRRKAWVERWSGPVTANELLLQQQDTVKVEVVENGKVIFSKQLPPATEDDSVRDVFLEVNK